MENGEFFEEIFDLKPIIPEIYSNGRSTKPQIPYTNNPPSNSTAAVPKLISFESSNSPKMDLNITNLDTNSDYSLTSEIINFSSSAKDDNSSSSNEYYSQSAKRSSSAAPRTPSQAMDHVVAERKRRENLSQLFISLSKVVPGLKKVGFCSVPTLYRSSPFPKTNLFTHPYESLCDFDFFWFCDEVEILLCTNAF